MDRVNINIPWGNLDNFIYHEVILGHADTGSPYSTKIIVNVDGEEVPFTADDPKNISTYRELTTESSPDPKTTGRQVSSTAKWNATTQTCVVEWINNSAEPIFAKPPDGATHERGYFIVYGNDGIAPNTVINSLDIDGCPVSDQPDKVSPWFHQAMFEAHLQAVEKVLREAGY